ncbi:MAG: Phage tail baseplate hub [Blastocatellia bacterium]|jgi:phage protein D|nr:Phage tail baseplate hub [Blastocatellia bacterium]
MTTGNHHAIVELDGQTWDSWEDPRLFERVTADLVTNEASEATWSIRDNNFRMIDRYTRADGVPLLPVRIWLGYGPDLGEPLFKGLLARVERGPNDTTFRFYDMGFKMRLVKKPGYHNKSDDVAIIKKLAERNGLKFEGPDKPLNLGPHDAVIQDEQTDWQHAMERAEDAGLILYVRQDTLFAKQPARVGKPKMTLAYRKDFTLLSDFSLTFKAPENQDGRPQQVKVHGRGRGGHRLTRDSDKSQRGHHRTHLKHDLPTHNKKSANRRAQAQKELQREHAFRCTVRIIPPAYQRADVRDTAQLTEMGKLFSGLYLCDSANYDFSARGLNTTYDLYRDVKE